MGGTLRVKAEPHCGDTREKLRVEVFLDPSRPSLRSGGLASGEEGAAGGVARAACPDISESRPMCRGRPARAPSWPGWPWHERRERHAPATAGGTPALKASHPSVARQLTGGRFANRPYDVWGNWRSRAVLVQPPLPPLISGVRGLYSHRTTNRTANQTS